MRSVAWRVARKWGLVAVFLGFAGAAVGDEQTAWSTLAERFQVAAPTMGGRQMWTDELVFREWRIQRHALTGHYRLLDGQDHRRAGGTFDQCRDELEQIKRDQSLPPIRGPVVLVLHGLTRSRTTMQSLVDHLQEQGDWTVLNVSYASTRADLAGHAAALERIIAHLDPGVTEISFVAHSLGNLVIRRYLHDVYRRADQGYPVPQFGRIVMLTPPNRGAQLAERLLTSSVLQWIWGDSAQQLAQQWDEVAADLAIPRGEFGIIAGGTGRSRGASPWLDGDDDGVIGVAETKLPGARDFLLLPVRHVEATRHAAVHAFTVNFLRTGHFIAEDQRQPLPHSGEWEG